MSWEKGETYVCSNPSCGLEVTVNRGCQLSIAGKTAVCPCGSPFQKRLP